MIALPLCVMCGGGGGGGGGVCDVGWCEVWWWVGMWCRWAGYEGGDRHVVNLPPVDRSAPWWRWLSPWGQLPVSPWALEHWVT